MIKVIGVSGCAMRNVRGHAHDQRELCVMEYSHGVHRYSTSCSVRPGLWLRSHRSEGQKTPTRKAWYVVGFVRQETKNSPAPWSNGQAILKLGEGRLQIPRDTYDDRGKYGYHIWISKVRPSEIESRTRDCTSTPVEEPQSSAAVTADKCAAGHGKTRDRASFSRPGLDR